MKSFNQFLNESEDSRKGEKMALGQAVEKYFQDKGIKSNVVFSEKGINVKIDMKPFEQDPKRYLENVDLFIDKLNFIKDFRKYVNEEQTNKSGYFIYYDIYLDELSDFFKSLKGMKKYNL